MWKNVCKLPQATLKIILLLLIVGVLVGLRLGELTQLHAEDIAGENRYLSMARQNQSAEAIAAEYHKTLNDLFNRNIKEFLALKPEEGEKLKEITKVPTDPKGCVKGNISTYCVARVATEEYAKFRIGLETAEQAIDSKISKGSVEKISKAIEKEKRFVERELEASKKTLDLALAAYDEFQTAYPLHQKYQEVVKALETYRNKLSSLRRVVEFVPVTFFNATTAQCK